MLLSRLLKRAYDTSNALLLWHYRDHWGMDIGKGVRISRTAKLDKTNPRGVKIGDYTSIAFGATILTHDFVNNRRGAVEIGSNCHIGARSIIMPGVKVGSNSIVGVASVVLSDVPPNSVVFGNPARVVESGITTGRWGIRNPAFLKLEGTELIPRKNVAAPIDNPQPGSSRDVCTEATLREILAQHISGEVDLSQTFEALGIDSFALVTIRAEIEHANNGQIPDEQWLSIERPAQLLNANLQKGTVKSGATSGAATNRHLTLGMPQMAMNGLSEGWLFKEIGDIHWDILTKAIGVQSRDITDQAGERLYATFTRINYRSTAPLSAFRENDQIEIDSNMTRFGAGIFFSNTNFRISSGNIACQVMSSFSKIGKSGDNTSLLKGQPEIPSGFSVPDLAQAPAFAAEYRALRAENLDAVIFSTEYQVIPQNDINGVGLLYFATYPVIAEICLSRFLGSEEALRWSPVERDISYFANCGPLDKIIYRIHEMEKSDAELRVAASMTRASDGKRMALIRHVSSQQ